MLPFFVNKKLLTDLIGGLLIALIVVVGYKLSPMLLPKADVTVMPDPGCSLHRGACKASLQDGGSIELSSSVQPIPMVKPFQVQVLLQGIAAQRVAVEDELRVRVSDEAFVLFPGRHSAPPAARVVRWMSREQIEAVAARRRRLIDGIELPQWPDSEHVCHGCGQRAACGAAGERLAGAVRRR